MCFCTLGAARGVTFKRLSNQQMSVTIFVYGQLMSVQLLCCRSNGSRPMSEGNSFYNMDISNTGIRAVG